MEILQEIAKALQDGEEEKVFELTKTAISRKLPARDILQGGLISGMNVVGEKFKEHEIFLPDVLMAAKAMYAGLNELKPLLASEKVASAGKIVLGTVQGDLHDIGKNLVGIMLKGSGFEVVDLGHDVSPEKFVETAEGEKADFIGLSALLTTTMPVMKKVVQLLKDRNLTGKIRTIIGGAPITERYAKEIGADAYAFDAGNAIDRLRQMGREST